jgi:hypothetical protein
MTMHGKLWSCPFPPHGKICNSGEGVAVLGPIIYYPVSVLWRTLLRIRGRVVAGRSATCKTFLSVQYMYVMYVAIL